MKHRQYWGDCILGGPPVGDNAFLEDWDLGYGPVDCSFSAQEIVSQAESSLARDEELKRRLQTPPKPFTKKKWSLPRPSEKVSGTVKDCRRYCVLEGPSSSGGLFLAVNAAPLLFNPLPPAVFSFGTAVGSAAVMREGGWIARYLMRRYG